MNIESTFTAAPVRTARWLGTDYTMMVRASDGGSIGTFRSTSAPGEGPPLHVHHGEDEAIHLLDGAADFWLDGRTIRLEAGQGIFLPRGVPHTFRVVGDRPAELLGVVTPGGFEGFFAAAAAAQVGPHDPAAMAAFAAPWRLEFLGPSPLCP